MKQPSSTYSCEKEKKEIKQSRMLEEDYLTSLLQSYDDIRLGKVRYFFRHSDRPFSKSIYVVFYMKDFGKRIIISEIRISDHNIKKSSRVCSSLIVYPNGVMTKGVKNTFFKLVESALKYYHYKYTKCAFAVLKGASV